MSVPKTKLVAESIAKLTERLPRGYAKTVVERLAERDIYHDDFYVRSVKSGAFFNEDVINELFNVADEEDARKAEQIKRAGGKIAE